MEKASIQNRLARLRKGLDDIGIDTIWIINFENRRYFSDFKAIDAQLNESSGSLFINRDQAILVTDSRYTVQARQEASCFEVITHNTGLIDILPEVFDRLDTRKLGFEDEHLVWSLYQKLKDKAEKQSPAAELRPVSGFLEGERKIKDQEEIDFLSKSAQLMGDVLSRVIGELKPGQTEREIAWKIETLAREGGAEGLSFPSIVASGPNSALPHATPTGRKIRGGEPVILDVGAKLEGYCSDMTRTIFLGNVPPDFKKIYRTVRDAQLAALNSVRPGMKCSDADFVAREIIKEAGYGEFFGHSLGHGIGIAPHERPSLSQRSTELLEEGMVFTIEPGIYIPEKGGVRLEEMVVLEKTGPRILTTNKDLYDF